jgi:broad specificity phosphatase PhoE
MGGTPTNLPEGPWPETVRRWVAGQTDYATPGAESFDALQARLLPVWERVTGELDGQTAVVVAHGVVIRVLLLSLLPGWSVARYHQLGPTPNVAITELTRQGAGQPWQAVRICQVVVREDHSQDQGRTRG